LLSSISNTPIISAACSEEVKMQLLSKNKLMDNVGNCSHCGREYSPTVKQWQLESFIKGGKKVLNNV